MKRKVIIDQDAFGPGGSNLQSILMVLQSPEVEVLGVTVVSGDGWVKENVSHVLRMLELIGRPEIPVVPGATYPLLNTQEATRRWEALYGKLPYKGAWMECGPTTIPCTVRRTTGPMSYHPLRWGRPRSSRCLRPPPHFSCARCANFPAR